MSQFVNVKENGKDSYSICIRDSYCGMAFSQERKICIVSDSRISSYYLEEVSVLWKRSAEVVISHIIEPGEEQKNLTTIQKLYEHLIQEHFERNDLLVALGGGVVGDLTGFAAATYLRGIRFVQMPTTLLAMVDSSIGGKTGVDFSNYKNMVGAFHQPSAVWINLSVLTTLTKEQYASGFGEIIKYGLLLDKAFYEWLRQKYEGLLNRSLPLLEEAVYKSCCYKQRIVENDPKEKGERAILNLGHTIGHAIEKLMDFQMLHGECVALGTVAAASISLRRGYLTPDEFGGIKDTFKRFGLPTSVTGLKPDEIIVVTKSDKKMTAGKIKFILLKALGEAVIDTAVTEEEMQLAIGDILAS